MRGIALLVGIGAFSVVEPNVHAALVGNAELDTAVTSTGTVSPATQYTLDPSGNVFYDDGDGVVDTGVDLGEWLLSERVDNNGFNYSSSGGVSGSGAFIQAASGNTEKPRAVLQFVNDGMVTTGRVSLAMDVYFNENSGSNLYYTVELFAWNDGEIAPSLTTGGATANAQSYRAWEKGDAIVLVDKARLYASDFAPSSWTNATIQSYVDLGSTGYDYYAWRIGVVGYEAGDEFAFDNVSVGTASAAGQWMSGKWGVGWRINPNSKSNVDNYNVATLVAQVKTIPDVSYVLFNLSDAAYGDTYLAPHSVLTTLNLGSTPNNDRDLFGELAQGFEDAGIKVIAYIACQGPAMLKAGAAAAYDAVLVDGVWTSQAMDNWSNYVFSVYGDTTDDTYKQAFAEIIVDEYAERYGALIDGWWFDNGSDAMNAPLLHEIVTSYNPNTVCTFNGSSLNLDYTSGHPTVLGTALPSDDVNLTKLLYPIEGTESGYFLKDDGSMAFGHMFMPMHDAWNAGTICWTAEQGADWLERCTKAGGVWTWNVDTSDGASMLRADTVALMKEIVAEMAIPNAAPTFTSALFSAGDAEFGVAYSGDIAGTATDVDGDTLTYAVLSGPDWLEVSTNGVLSGTPDSTLDVGMNRFVVEVGDGHGDIDKATLEIAVNADFRAYSTVSFDDLRADLSSGAINGLDASDSNVSISKTMDGNDTVYSFSIMNQNMDNLGEDDSLSWDVRVKGFSGGTYTLNGNDSSVSLGSNVPLNTDDYHFGISGQLLSAGDSLQFSVENIELSAALGTTVEFSGFDGLWGVDGSYIYGEGDGGLEAFVLTENSTFYPSSPTVLTMTAAENNLRLRDLDGWFSVYPNNEPMVVSKNKKVNEDESCSVSLRGTDIDGDSLTYALVSAPMHGVLTGTLPVVTYVPATNYNGSDFFTYKANDGFVDSTIETVSVKVNAVNDAPVFSSTPPLALAKVGVPFDGSLFGSATDVDSDDAMTYSKESGPVWLTVSTNGMLRGIPGEGDVGLNAFMLTVEDKANASDSVRMDIAVHSDLSFTASSSGAGMEWNSVSGCVYQIYWSSNLLSGFSLIESNALGGAFFDADTAEEPAGFYKVTVELAP